jgi:hypothetical protein
VPLCTAQAKANPESSRYPWEDDIHPEKSMRGIAAYGPFVRIFNILSTRQEQTLIAFLG